MTAKHYSVVIACGGTGGHLFPGLAVADQLRYRACDVTLMVSQKEVDQEAVRSVSDMRIVTLPAVGLQKGALLRFGRGFWESYQTSLSMFQRTRPDAALAMGGFTSAPPIMAAWRCGADTFLHESNTLPGRANRWLAWVAGRAFVGFPTTAKLLRNRQVTVTGTPVRPAFTPRDTAACRSALGLDPARPVVVVVGGSQGAHGVNEMVLQAMPRLQKVASDWQWFHLAGPKDAPVLREAYTRHGLQAIVRPFFDQMEIALGAASAAISRAGASSLAELAAMKVPAILVPFPSAVDNHQFFNAAAFAQSGAARLLEQKDANPQILCQMLNDLVDNPAARQLMQGALSAWQTPQAAEQIADAILQTIDARRRKQRAALFTDAKPLPELAPAGHSFRRTSSSRGFDPFAAKSVKHPAEAEVASAAMVKEVIA